MSGVAVPSTENHRSFVGGVVRAGRIVRRVTIPLDWTCAAVAVHRIVRVLSKFGWESACQIGLGERHLRIGQPQIGQERVDPAPSIARTRDRSTAAVSESHSQIHT